MKSRTPSPILIAWMSIACVACETSGDAAHSANPPLEPDVTPVESDGGAGTRHPPDAALDGAPDSEVEDAWVEPRRPEDDCVSDADCPEGQLCHDAEFCGSEHGYGCPRVCSVRLAGCFEAGCSADEFCHEELFLRERPTAWCAPRLPAGEVCDAISSQDRATNVCVDGYVCAGDSPSRCVPGTVDVGGAPGDPCRRPGDCGPTAYCDVGEGLCRERGGPGTPCSVNQSIDGLNRSDACAPGLFCVFSPDDECHGWLECRSAGSRACCRTDEGARCFDATPADCVEPLGRCATL